MQRSKEFQFLVGNHLHYSLMAAMEDSTVPTNSDISIVKGNQIITTLPRQKAEDLAKTILALDNRYGDEMIGVILHGSYAINEAKENSDIDLFILIKEGANLSELRRFKSLLSNSIDAHFSTVDYFWNIDCTMHQNIMRKGLLLWVS